MKFLAIDTSGKRLLALAVNGEKIAFSDGECAMQHSVCLFPEIERVLSEAALPLSCCDFLACVKGLCFGAEKRALPVTSFDAVAYAVGGEDKIAAVDAGHGYLYAKGYGRAALAAGYYPAEEVLSLARSAGAPLLAAEELPYASQTVSLREGLLNYCRAHADEAGEAQALAAVYIRRSNAEEGR